MFIMSLRLWNKNLTRSWDIDSTNSRGNPNTFFLIEHACSLAGLLLILSDQCIWIAYCSSGRPSEVTPELAEVLGLEYANFDGPTVLFVTPIFWYVWHVERCRTNIIYFVKLQKYGLCVAINYHLLERYVIKEHFCDEYWRCPHMFYV
jgi:hypothetical protein